MSKKPKAHRKGRTEFEDKWSEYFRRGIQSLEKGDEKLFLEQMQQALKEAQSLEADEESASGLSSAAIKDRIATTLEALGGYFIEIEELQTARKYLELGMNHRLEAGSIDEESLEDLARNLSLLYSELHLHEEDIQHCERILEFLEKRHGSESPELVASLIGLAQSFESVANMTRAEELYKRVLAITESYFGKDSGEYDEAIETLEEFQREKNVCSCHPLAEQLRNN